MKEREEKREAKKERIEMLYRLEKLVNSNGDAKEIKRISFILGLNKDERYHDYFDYEVYKYYIDKGMSMKEIAGAFKIKQHNLEKHVKNAENA